MVKVAQLVRAPDCGSGGRGFESPLSPFFSENEGVTFSPENAVSLQFNALKPMFPEVLILFDLFRIVRFFSLWLAVFIRPVLCDTIKSPCHNRFVLLNNKIG